MSIEKTLADVVMAVATAESGGRAEARVLALASALGAEFGDMPTPQLMLALADMLGRLCQGNDKAATALCAR
jgi:hypothetical protein